MNRERILTLGIRSRCSEMGWRDHLKNGVRGKLTLLRISQAIRGIPSGMEWWNDRYVRYSCYHCAPSGGVRFLQSILVRTSDVGSMTVS